MKSVVRKGKQQSALFNTSSVASSPRKMDTKFRTYQHEFYGRVLTLQGYEKFALAYLVDKMGISPKDIVCECENDFGTTLGIRYKYAGKWRTYHPDAYVKSKRTVIEVKSIHTLGLRSNKKRGWSMTCAKARATRERGYNMILMLMQNDGSRIPMPKGWYDMKKADVVKAIAQHIPKQSLLNS